MRSYGRKCAIKVPYFSLLHTHTHTHVWDLCRSCYTHSHYLGLRIVRISVHAFFLTSSSNIAIRLRRRIVFVIVDKTTSNLRTFRTDEQSSFLTAHILLVCHPRPADGAERSQPPIFHGSPHVTAASRRLT